MNPRVWQLLVLGWYIALCLVLGILAGVWMDRQFGLAPLFLLLGLTLGLISAFYGMMRMLAQATQKDDGSAPKE